MPDQIFEAIFPNYTTGSDDKKCIRDATEPDKRTIDSIYSAFFGAGVIVGFELLQDLVPGGTANARIVSLQDPTKMFNGTVYDPMNIGFYGSKGKKGYATPVYVEPFDMVQGISTNPNERRKLFAGLSRDIDMNKFKYAIINMQC